MELDDLHLFLREFARLVEDLDRDPHLAYVVQQAAEASVGVLIAGIVAALAAWRNEQWLKEQIYFANAKKPFKDCADCPEMVVVPEGEFMMGSPPTEKRAMPDEFPQHRVTIARPFAVSRYDLTFNDWDACVAVGGCPRS